MKATTTDKYEIAAKVELAELDGFTGRMPAKQQRAIFGAALFGRKLFTIDASRQGRVHGTYSCAFGTDSAFFSKSFDDIAEAASSGARLGF